MILVREVFKLKVGKAKEAKGLINEAAVLGRKYGMPEGRALTDLTGPYYTFVWEHSHPTLADWEQSMASSLGAEDWSAWYQRFAPLLAEGGHREIFTIVE
jgi:hypothetical protein